MYKKLSIKLKNSNQLYHVIDIEHFTPPNTLHNIFIILPILFSGQSLVFSFASHPIIVFSNQELLAFVRNYQLHEKMFPMLTNTRHFTQTNTYLFWARTDLSHYSAPVAFAQNPGQERINVTYLKDCFVQKIMKFAQRGLC